MRQVWVSYPGPPDVLFVKDAPDPKPGTNEVLVRSHAMGVNFADVLVRLGRYPMAPPTPCVPGFEVAGVVEAVGNECKEFKPGDRVLVMCRFGGYSDIVTAPEELVFHLPDELDFNAATTLMVNYLTAQLLIDRSCSVKSGERVLIHSAAGGVGLALIDLCKKRNASIVALASFEKHPFLRDRGVQDVHDSKDPDFGMKLEKVYGDKAFDVVFDSRGGNAWKQSYQLLTAFGRLSVFGYSSIVQPEGMGFAVNSKKLGEVGWFGFDAYDLVNDNRAICGVNLATLWHLPSFVSTLRSTIDNLIRALVQKDIHPWIDRSFALTEAASAHEYLQSRKSIGKITLTP